MKNPAAHHMQRGSKNQSTSSNSKTPDTNTPAVRRSTSKATQHATILKELRYGPKTTDQLRAAGAYTPGARIFELRARGYDIRTDLFEGYAVDGLEHWRLARYTLHEPEDMAAAEVDQDTEQKRFAILAAQFSEMGHTLIRSTRADVATVPYYSARWGWMRPVRSLDHAEQLLEQIREAKS